MSVFDRKHKLFAFSYILAALGNVFVLVRAESEASAEMAEDCLGLVAEGRFAQAVPICNIEIRSKEEVDVKLLLARAKALAHEGQTTLAINDFDAVLKERPTDSEALKGRAELHLRQGNFEAALSGRSQEKEFVAKVNDAQAKFNKAVGLMESKEWDRANSLLESLQLDDKITASARIYSLRAECLTWQGKYMDAVRMYQGRSTLELESSETEYEVGKLYLALGNLEKGRKLIDDCARNNSSHKKALALRKRLKAIAATIEEADRMLIKQAVAALEEALQQTAAISPQEPYYDERLPGMLAKSFELPILKLLCSKHIRLKQTDLALERCQKVLDLTKDAPASNRSKNDEESAYLSLGEAFASADKFEEAIGVLRKAQQAFPRSQRVNEALQKASKDLKKSKQRDYYKILGVPKDATESDIRRAYNKQARRWHPDKQPDEASKKEASEKMQELNAAVAVLTDKKKRRLVDQGIDPEDPQGGQPQWESAGHPFGGFGGGGSGGFAFNFEDLFRQAGHGGGGGRRTYQHHQGGGGRGGHHQHHYQHHGGHQRNANFEDFFKFDL